MDRPSSTTAGPWWVVLATLFGGMFLLQGGRNPPTAKEEGRGAKSSATRPEGDNEVAVKDPLRQPLLQFLGTGNEWREGSPWQEERKQYVRQLEFLIVTV